MADKQAFPPQHQDKQPGRTKEMHPKPQDEMKAYKPAGKLSGKRALVTGGDSGIGRAVAIGFAKEGADVVIVYLGERRGVRRADGQESVDLDEHEDAEHTKRLVEAEGRKCATIAGDVGREAFCRDAVARAVEALGGLDILVNNAAEQHVRESFDEITEESLLRTYRTNVFGPFFLTKHALHHLGEGGVIINTPSITAHRGNEDLIDYSTTKGALVTFTRSLAKRLADKKIRVNAVAPGPIWTPLIPSSFDEEKVAKFGTDHAMGRAGQPDEVAPCFIFLASADSSYMTGQVLHPNGGAMVES